MAAKLRWKIAQWAERKWWQIYLKNKKTSDYATWKIDYWTNFLEQCNHLHLKFTVLNWIIVLF